MRKVQRFFDSCSRASKISFPYGAADALSPLVKSVLALFFLMLAAASGRAEDLRQQVIAEINLARTAPGAYAQILASHDIGQPRDRMEAIRFLQHVRSLPPLACSYGLSLGAQLHVADQGPRGAIGHNGSGWQNTPWSRMARFGQWVGSAAENIDYGHSQAREVVCAWIVDTGVSSRGHRRNLFNPSYGVVGVACGPHAKYRAMCVSDFAGAYIERGGAFASL